GLSMATKRVPYTDAAGRRRWVEVESGLARDLDSFDRWARKRDALFRRTHELATDRGGPRGGRAVRLVGYLSYEMEPAARAAGLASDEGYPWEGKRVEFTL